MNHPHKGKKVQAYNNIEARRIAKAKWFDEKIRRKEILLEKK